MSKIIVPDDVLATQLCDNCHKYLSAKPVKVGKRQILCGRCVDENNTKFVDSYYQVFAESALFKCVNHFDGCNKLLAFDQVIDHERYCKGEEYDCFLCPSSSPKLPINTLQYHVRKHHPKSFLHKKHFTVELIHRKINIFFHPVEDCLFFIKESFNRENKTILLDAVGVGKYFQSLKIKVKYSIILKDQKIIQVDSENWDNSQMYETDDNNSKCIIAVNNAEEGHIITVIFDIEIPKSVNLIQLDSNKSTNNNHTTDDNLSDSKFLRSQVNIKEESTTLSLSKIIKNELAFIDTKEQAKCAWSRLLKFKQDNIIENSHVSISSCETKLVINKFVNCKTETILICFHCILCKCILKNITGNFVFKYGSQRHLVCKCCYIHVSNFYELIPLKSLISNEVFLSVQYSCIRGCRIYGSPDNNDHIYHHYDSTLFSEKSCCMENCEFMATSVSSLIRHFQISHDEQLLFLAENLMNIFDASIPHGEAYKKMYILQYDVIIEVLLTFSYVYNKYCISAKICDKNKENLNLLMHVLEEKEGKWKYVDTFFERQLVLETNANELAVRCIVL